MQFSTLIAFCIAQVLVLTGVLTLKKFRNRVNLLLGVLFVTLIFNLAYYMVYYKGGFDQLPLLTHLILLIQLFPPPIIWLYASSLKSGRIEYRKKMLLHTIPIGIGFLFFIPLFAKTLYLSVFNNDMLMYNKWFGFIFSVGTGMSYILYSRAIILLLIKKQGFKARLIEYLFDHSQQQIVLVKVLSLMMNLHALIIILGGLYSFINLSKLLIFSYLDAGFLVLLSYLLIFILTTNPKVIHFKYTKQYEGKNFLWYERSGLTREEAMQCMSKMNQWMKSEKPYLNSDISLGDLAEKMELPGHIVSEVLNGLLKQNFYDYINNYRIEEFKSEAQLEKNARETNLNLAFQCGFNSKTTFNNSFKKFTGQTPSEFRQSIKSKK